MEQILKELQDGKRKSTLFWIIAGVALGIQYKAFAVRLDNIEDRLANIEHRHP